MAKFKGFKILVGATSLLFSFTAFSAQQVAEQNNAKQTQGMPKDAWIAAVKKEVTKPICKGFFDDASIAEKFKQLNVTYEKCLQEIPPIMDGCVKDYYDKLPAEIDEKAAAKWGRNIGECIGSQFALKYLYVEQEKKTN